MRVLIAEDDLITRRVLSMMLTGWGYQVVTVGDGNAAWEVISRPDAPRLMLLDWEMPGLDGVEICRRLRGMASEPYIYVLLLTGRESHKDLIVGLDAGADDYLTKPFDDAELAARLRVGRRITKLQEELFRAREALRHQTLHDGLTSVLNRTGALEALGAEVSAVRAGNGSSLCVVMFDLDHFKRINDTWGHAAGDLVLRGVAQRVGASLRATDRLGRVGGEEFLILLQGSDRATAWAMAERVRTRIGAEPFYFGEIAISVTASVGFCWLDDVNRADSLIALADQALYRAKNQGRNRVVEADCEVLHAVGA
jgi:diguanylate cyclase (GGDEF)-like protein